MGHQASIRASVPTPTATHSPPVTSELDTNQSNDKAHTHLTQRGNIARCGPSAAPDGSSGGVATVSLTRLQPRRSARAAESARLEIVCWATNRGFKSHLLRSRRRLNPSGSPADRSAWTQLPAGWSTHPPARRLCSMPSPSGPVHRTRSPRNHPLRAMSTGLSDNPELDDNELTWGRVGNPDGLGAEGRARTLDTEDPELDESDLPGTSSCRRDEDEDKDGDDERGVGRRAGTGRLRAGDRRLRVPLGQVPAGCGRQGRDGRRAGGTGLRTRRPAPASVPRSNEWKRRFACLPRGAGRGSCPRRGGGPGAGRGRGSRPKAAGPGAGRGRGRGRGGPERGRKPRNGLGSRPRSRPGSRPRRLERGLKQTSGPAKRPRSGRGRRPRAQAVAAAEASRARAEAEERRGRSRSGPGAGRSRSGPGAGREQRSEPASKPRNGLGRRRKPGTGTGRGRPGAGRSRGTGSDRSRGAGPSRRGHVNWRRRVPWPRPRSRPRPPEHEPKSRRRQRREHRWPFRMRRHKRMWSTTHPRGYPPTPAHGTRVTESDRRIRAATVVAACILLVVAVGAVVLRSIDRAPSAPEPSRPTTGVDSAAFRRRRLAGAVGHRRSGLGDHRGQGGLDVAVRLPHPEQRRHGHQPVHRVVAALRDVHVRRRRAGGGPIGRSHR